VQHYAKGIKVEIAEAIVPAAFCAFRVASSYGGSIGSSTNHGASGTRGKKRVRFGEFSGFAAEFAGLLVILS